MSLPVEQLSDTDTVTDTECSMMHMPLSGSSHAAHSAQNAHSFTTVESRGESLNTSFESHNSVDTDPLAASKSTIAPEHTLPAENSVGRFLPTHHLPMLPSASEGTGIVDGTEQDDGDAQGISRCGSAESIVMGEADVALKSGFQNHRLWNPDLAHDQHLVPQQPDPTQHHHAFIEPANQYQLLQQLNSAHHPPPSTASAHQHPPPQQPGSAHQSPYDPIQSWFPVMLGVSHPLFEDEANRALFPERVLREVGLLYGGNEYPEELNAKKLARAAHVLQCYATPGVLRELASFDTIFQPTAQ